MPQNTTASLLPIRLVALAAAGTAAAIIAATLVFSKKSRKKKKPAKKETDLVEDIPMEVKKEVIDVVDVVADQVDNIATVEDIKKDHEMSWCDIMEAEEKEKEAIAVIEAPVTKPLELVKSTNDDFNRRDSGVDEDTYAKDVVVVPRVDSPSSSSAVSTSSNGIESRKLRSDSGCSYGTADEAIVKSNNNGTSGDSGNSSTEMDDGMTYVYHFMVPGRLCGVLIGSRGSTVQQLKMATKCNITLMSPSRGSKKTAKEPQLCIIQGRRTGIDRCLVLLRDMFPLYRFPDFTLDQINLPTHDEAYRSIQTPSICACQLEYGPIVDVTVSAIVSGGQLFVQQPHQPTFAFLERLEYCMLNVYERLRATVPQVPREIVQCGLICVTKSDDQWYRVQVVACDASKESCEVKFLDYGGYAYVYLSDLWQIRSDFLALPFQAVECYLSNVIPPNGNEWPFESGVHLEQLIRNQVCSLRVVGYSETNVPFVRLHATYESETASSHLVNRELVERGVAQWIEHTADMNE